MIEEGTGENEMVERKGKWLLGQMVEVRGNGGEKRQNED